MPRCATPTTFTTPDWWRIVWKVGYNHWRSSLWGKVGYNHRRSSLWGKYWRFLVCWSSGIFRCKGIQLKRQQICEPEPKKTYEINEKEKKRTYNERVQEIEHSLFTPIVMSATGGMAKDCSKFYSCLSEMIAEKRDQLYSVIASWIPRKISFSLIRSIGMCIRGSRSVTLSNDL